MAYISGSGTKFVALTLALAASLISVPAPAQQNGAALGKTTLDVAISGLRNTKGNVLICLTANAKAFPDCSKDAESKKAVIPAPKAQVVRFHGIAPGTYAVSLIHDENANGKLDVKVMIPGEGFGFSRNPAVVFGPPSFKSARFAIGAVAASQPVKMKYML
jgi:uncharacterized protein (DUF2141 family)